VKGEKELRPQKSQSVGALFRAFAADWSPRVEGTLAELLPERDTEPAKLHAAMRYVIFPGGKRLRPMLVLLGAKVTGGDPSRVLRPAAAVELLHGYSLVHDDLPCMDDDDLRRGQPTCHKVFGEAMAVLVGDALLTLAFEAMADGGADAVRVLAQAAGSQGMVGGQVADMAAQGPGNDGNPTAGDVAWIHDHKTGALITACLEIGAVAGGGSQETLAAIQEYGGLCGRAFQIADDCLDVTGGAEDLGKQPGQDQSQNKLTWPAVMGLSESMAEARRLATAAAKLAPAILGWHQGPGSLDSETALLQDVALYTVLRGS
jgi:geranylgeranyl diphosphate synthase type II